MEHEGQEQQEQQEEHREQKEQQGQQRTKQKPAISLPAPTFSCEDAASHSQRVVAALAQSA